MLWLMFKYFEYLWYNSHKDKYKQKTIPTWRVTKQYHYSTSSHSYLIVQCLCDSFTKPVIPCPCPVCASETYTLIKNQKSVKTKFLWSRQGNFFLGQNVFISPRHEYFKWELITESLRLGAVEGDSANSWITCPYYHTILLLAAYLNYQPTGKSSW